MPLLQLILLAVIQGVTEFLPISSSGHLILLPGLTGLQDQGQFLDVAVHLGTLVAVILYFWSDVKHALVGALDLLRGRTGTQNAALAICLGVAVVPVVLAGAVLHFSGLSDALRSVAVIGWAMLGFGLVLYWADRFSPAVKPAESWSPKDALIMGIWQILALIPGTSRSGITITGARRLGYDRESAARLSMLMSIPTILASGVLLGMDVALEPNATVLRDVGLAAAFSCVSALLALSLMMRLLRSVSFTPYVIYRVGLGVVLLVIAYT